MLFPEEQDTYTSLPATTPGTATHVPALTLVELRQLLVADLVDEAVGALEEASVEMAGEVVEARISGDL